ncbi:paraquat-inducible protein A [Bradyrhizobium sp. 131]|uniref:paraquat-inducible protein A n=1 Tax=Bradyrhizobium sp. 131 TaxID=2782609 RepID=UPI001FFEE822|nr:paraquat-inducible protein A [Bradyrhizobium sp. 131]UPK23401.1 paraquat-inducible protein A [Bradyrhizobium sp. 131]
MAGAAPDQAKEKRRHAAANLATGWQRLIGPAIAVNMALFVYVMFEPILVTRIAFLSRNEIILSKVAYDLYGTDTVLFLVVFLFGIVAPGIKLLAFAFVWYFLDVHQTKRHNKWLVVLGKLAMTEIMLLAMVVVAIKGTGIGSVDIKPGLYFYVVLVLGSLLLSLLVDQQLAALPHSDSRSESGN